MPPTRLPDGRFPKGVSGNSKGRPPKLRADSALVPQQPVPTATRTRRDGWINSASGHGTIAHDRRRLTRYGVDIVTDLEAQQLWRSEFLAAAIIEQGPREGFSRGWRFKCEDKELAEEVGEDVKRLGTTKTVVEAAMKENAYGGAAIFPVMSGSLGDLSEELDERGIASIDALHVLEPQELTPADYYTDIRHPKFRKPMTWRFTPLTAGRAGFVQTVIIHESRLIILPGTQVSVQTQPGQRQGWGDSQLCRPWTVISDFGLAWGSAATLLHNHGKETLEMDGFANIMGQADGVQEFDRYLEAMWSAWSTLRMNVIDGKSRISRATGTLAGVSELLNEFKVLMAAAARRPVSVLMGQSQSGLRTGDDDTRTWYKTVESDRTDRWHPPLEKLIRLQLLATTGPTSGKEPPLWSIEYPSLWSPSDKEVAETRKMDMERAQIAVNTQIASADDVAESFFGGDTYSPDIHINWERRKAQQAVQQMGAEDLTDEDRAAMGGEQEDLSDDEIVELQSLQDEFGTEDGANDAEPEPEEDPDEEDDPEEDDDREDSWDLDDDEWREDQVGMSASGHGYNPYRAKDGKFGAGAHKEKPSAGERHAAAAARAGERVGRAKASVDKHAAKLAEAHQSKHAALAETRSALAKASVAAELARAKPTAKNIKAAQVATNKATRAQAKVGKHEAAIGKHTAAHEKATAAHAKATEAHGKTQAKIEKSGKTEPKGPKAKQDKTPKESATQHVDPNSIPSPGARNHPDGSPGKPDLSAAFANRSAIVNAASYDKAGNASFTPEGQKAIREHHDAVAAAYGLQKRSLPNGHVVEIAEIKEMGGSQAQFEENGGIRIPRYNAQQLTWHAKATQNELKNGRPYDGDEIQTYHAVTHESTHGHGPGIPYEGHGILADEAATEIVARRITADIHNLQSTDIGLAGRGGGNNKHGSYNKHIYSMAHAIGEASGHGSKHGFQSLEHAAFAMKRLSPDHEFKTGDAALHHLTELAANHAGIKDPTARSQLHEDMRFISDDLRGKRARDGKST